MSDLENLRYPVGKFTRPEKIKKSEVKRWIKEIDKLPKRLKDAVKTLTEEQLNTVYRDGGWTVRQVIHHVADSHMNAYIRMRLALTEENPQIKPYKEDRWGELIDSKTADIKFSLNLLAGLHKRWIMLLKSLQKEDYKKTFFHPDQQRNITLEEIIGLYAWHSNHHLSHITELKKRKGW